MPGALKPPHIALALAALFLLALIPRLYLAEHRGYGWDAPDSFELVNFDEAGSCRAALDGFDYTPFIGVQTIVLAEALGYAPDADIRGDAQAVRAYCHDRRHIRVARWYSAVTGAATVAVVGALGLLLLPTQPAVGLVAAALVALSGFHIVESAKATVDAPSTFFIYSALAALVAARAGRRWLWWLVPPLLLAALWTKYWVFALAALLPLLPAHGWRQVFGPISTQRAAMLALGGAALFGLISNPEFSPFPHGAWLLLFYLLPPWGVLNLWQRVLWTALPLLALALVQVPVIEAFSTGSLQSVFGTGYGAIGWDRWLRNALNLPMVTLLSLGLPALVAAGVGLWCLWRGRVESWHLWLLLPLMLFALFMLFVSPVTYYRHYLPLVPAMALLAGLGLAQLRWRRSAMLLAMGWCAALAVDIAGDPLADPRAQARSWFAEHPEANVLFSYYVNPPQRPGQNLLFHPAQADSALASAPGGARQRCQLDWADFVILSESWYDTSQRSELNGPRLNDPARLIKTTPELAAFYQQALADASPALALETVLIPGTFMPEARLHKRYYGSFLLFTGDLAIFRVTGGCPPA